MLVVPFPKFHRKDVGFPVEELVNVTVRGAVPDCVLALKREIGGVVGALPVTVMVLLLVLVDKPFVTLRVTVYVPAVK